MTTNDIQIQFGKRVQTFRKARGLTQEQLAEKIDRTVDTVSNIERGFSSTRIKTAAKLAEVLEVELVDFFVSPTESELSAEQAEIQKILGRLIESHGVEKAKEALTTCERLLGLGGSD